MLAATDQSSRSCGTPLLRSQARCSYIFPLHIYNIEKQNQNIKIRQAHFLWKL